MKQLKWDMMDALPGQQMQPWELSTDALEEVLSESTQIQSRDMDGLLFTIAKHPKAGLMYIVQSTSAVVLFATHALTPHVRLLGAHALTAAFSLLIPLASKVL